MKMEYFQGRMEVFRDSVEVANGVGSCKNELDMRYWNREAAVHIEGLWGLCLELYTELKRRNRKLSTAL